MIIEEDNVIEVTLEKKETEIEIERENLPAEVTVAIEIEIPEETEKGKEKENVKRVPGTPTEIEMIENKNLIEIEENQTNILKLNLKI